MKINYRKISFMRLRDKKGSVLLTTFMLITVLLILGVAFMVASSNEARVSESQRKIAQAFNIAEAGIERMIYDLKEDFSDDENWSDGDINAWTYNSSDIDADSYYPFPDASDSGNNAYVSTALGDGSYSVSLKSGSGGDDLWVRSTGTIGSISQTIEIYVTIIDLSPWDNAIFGGSGSSGGWVNGNVNVTGSVHILGEDLNPGDNAIDLGGTAELVRNNYDILPAALEALVPALPTTTFNGEVVETLNAELRVKNGIVGLSGSSTLGEPDDPGDGEKETVDGVYITDGYNGNQGASNVYSDNGTAEAYDLGDAATFPLLTDPYPANPTQDYYGYFNDNALILTTELANISPGVGNGFSYGDCASNCITMTDAGEMEIQGIVYVTGSNDLLMSGADITYEGSGSILVTGDATIDVNLLVDGTLGKNSYPTNILGIMTPNDIVVGAGSQTNVMGLFYAEGEVETNMQTNLVGTIVANQFNITNQVPSIFQVPEVANNLPHGMIGGEAVNFIKIVSWQKIDNPS